MRTLKAGLAYLATGIFTLAVIGIMLACIAMLPLTIIDSVDRKAKARDLFETALYKVECEGMSPRYTNSLTDCPPYIVIEDYAIDARPWRGYSFFYGEDTLEHSKCEVTVR